MKLEDIFTPEELASIDSGTYDITRPVLAAKLDLWAALEREACANVCDAKVDAEYATGKVDHNEMGWTQACAIAIRARGGGKL